jgi:clan AA aspartic protease
MITGVVRKREPRIRLRVRGPGERRQTRAVVDTGSTGYLTLPPALIAALGLPWQGIIPAFLADGSSTVLDVYEGTVVWERRPRKIPVVEADATPLVGMALLESFEFTMQVRRGGKVTIRRLA